VIRLPSQLCDTLGGITQALSGRTTRRQF
jgi:hypothetical protein